MPLTQSMGWTNSPPIFCTATETIFDITNKHFLWHHMLPLHCLKETAMTGPTPMTPQTPMKACLPCMQQPNQHHWWTTATLGRSMAYVNVFMDDFISVVQGSQHHCCAMLQQLLQTIDNVFCPLDRQDSFHWKEPISIKKVQTGDTAWSTTKTILGWTLDTKAMTLALPQLCSKHLAELLASIPTTHQCISTLKWHQTLGELHSMALAIPGAHRLFSLLQEAFCQPDNTATHL